MQSCAAARCKKCGYGPHDRSRHTGVPGLDCAVKPWPGRSARSWAAVAGRGSGPSRGPVWPSAGISWSRRCRRHARSDRPAVHRVRQRQPRSQDAADAVARASTRCPRGRGRPDRRVRARREEHGTRSRAGCGGSGTTVPGSSRPALPTRSPPRTRPARSSSDPRCRQLGACIAQVGLVSPMGSAGPVSGAVSASEQASQEEVSGSVDRWRR